MRTISEQAVYDTRKFGDYIVRWRGYSRTIEMTFAEFQRLAFLKPVVRKRTGVVDFKETEL